MFVHYNMILGVYVHIHSVGKTDMLQEYNTLSLSKQDAVKAAGSSEVKDEPMAPVMPDTDFYQAHSGQFITRAVWQAAQDAQAEALDTKAGFACSRILGSTNFLGWHVRLPKLSDRQLAQHQQSQQLILSLSVQFSTW